jgi:heptosyltransferase I
MPVTPLPLLEPPASLCLLRLSALGDVSHMVPVIRSIQAQWPATRVSWCLGKLEHQLVGDLDGIEFLVVDKASGWRGAAALRRQLRGRHFDVLMHAQVSLRANLLSLMINSPLRLGFDQQRSRDFHGLFINRRIPPQRGQHVLDGFFSFAATLGVSQRVMRWGIPVPAAAEQAAREQLPGDEPVLIISPCSSHELRNWRAERYARVADYAVSRYGFRVALCGGPSAAERRMGDAIVDAMQHSPLDLIGKDTIKQLLALLSRASLLISPDSGPMHLATATGTPVIGLHAASNPRRSGPYLSQQWCVDRYDAAARAFLGKPSDAIKWGTRIERPGVMDLVTVDDVVERLDAFMATQAPTRA